MGKIIVQKETTLKPITLIGKEAGICYGSDVTNEEKNYKRGLMNIKSGHGRTLEFPQVYLEIHGYSARVIRELYTHIGGGPTRLQASTRYIDYVNFDYITPPDIQKDETAKNLYASAMNTISMAANELKNLGVSKEDIANILPLGMRTDMVLRTNLRQLIDMSHQRLCTRAYWEFRRLMKDIMKALSEYSEEWQFLIKEYFVPKCKYMGYCPEHNSCKIAISKEEFEEKLKKE